MSNYELQNSKELPKLRPTTSNLKQNPKSKSKLSMQKIPEIQINTNPNISLEKNSIIDNIKTKTNKDKTSNMISIETEDINTFDQHKKTINNITLMEKEVNTLYDWNTLFNNSKPISYYTKYPLKIETNGDNKENDKFSFPVALIDAPPEQVELFIPTANNSNIINDTKNKSRNAKSERNKNIRTFQMHSNKIFINNNQNKNKKILKISESTNKGEVYINGSDLFKGKKVKTKSIYSPLEQDECFYLSDCYSDYFKEDLKTFAMKFPLLKAKIYTNPFILKTAIKNMRKIVKNKENKIRNIKMTDKLKLDKQKIIIAGKRKNSRPLLKSVYMQVHQLENNNFDIEKKYYRNTAKPLGNDNGDVDYSKNDRTAHIREFIHLRDKYLKDMMNNKSKRSFSYVKSIEALNLDTYDENDPQLKIFKMNKNREDNQMRMIAEIDNNDNNNNIEVIMQKRDIKYNSEKNKIKRKKKIEINVDMKPNTRIYRKFSPIVSSNTNNYNLISKRPVTSHQIHSNPNNINTIHTNVISTSNGLETCKGNSIKFINRKNFPLRINSAFPNQRYQKINNMLQKKREYKLMMNYLNPADDDVKNILCHQFSLEFPNKGKIRPQSYIAQRSEITNVKKFQSSSTNTEDNKKVNYLYFNKYIDNAFYGESKKRELDPGFYYPINFYNKSKINTYYSRNNFLIQHKESDYINFILNCNIFSKSEIGKKDKGKKSQMVLSTGAFN